ncbi:hypothetical protein DFI02_110143 [Rhizobium sp. PP-F2F-G20b]|nr:hypothetical protein DFI02_110143 [Rhizobium sp. PP-F2F-G20b]
MNYRLAPALLFLAMASTAHAEEIPDDTPTRAFTIGKPEGDMNRVIVHPTIMSMSECREAMYENAEALKGESDFMLCIPADMTDKDKKVGDIPYTDLNQ